MKITPSDVLCTLGEHEEEARKHVDFYKNLKDNFESKSREYQNLIQAEKSRYTRSLVRESRMPRGKSLFFFLRKWNSYTPAIPAYNRTSVGGGYFIWHEGIGIVIDPGYNFLENFYRAGGSITDIDKVIITHAHDDHTIQLEQLVSLLIKFNDEKPNIERKKVHFLLSVGTFQKFSPLIDLSSDVFSSGYTVLNVRDEIQLKNEEGDSIGTITALPTYHYEICSHDYGIGILFELHPAKNADNPKRVLMTSDTGLVPLNKSEKSYAVPNDSFEEKELIFNQYLDILAGREVNLMLLHIGSIKEGEMSVKGQSIADIVKEHLNAKLKLGELRNDETLSEEQRIQQKATLERVRDSYYPNHLGWLGVREVIARCNPKVAVISEWGEELKRFRCDLVQQLESVLDHFEVWSTKIHFIESLPETSRIVPGDLSLVYSILDEKFFNSCSVLDSPNSNKWFLYKYIDYLPASDENPSDLYYFPKIDVNKNSSKEYFVANREDIVDCFCHYQKHRKFLYFGAPMEESESKSLPDSK